jgi:hypothetical protein
MSYSLTVGREVGNEPVEEPCRERQFVVTASRLSECRPVGPGGLAERVQPAKSVIARHLPTGRVREPCRSTIAANIGSSCFHP